MHTTHYPKIILKSKFTSWVMTSGNSLRSAYGAAVMAMATGSVGATDKTQEQDGTIIREASVTRLDLYEDQIPFAFIIKL
jgi:hypothetical protein